jgi:hypothetical protein
MNILLKNVCRGKSTTEGGEVTENERMTGEKKLGAMG